MKIVSRITLIVLLGVATLFVFASASRDANARIREWFRKSPEQITAETRAREARAHAEGLVAAHYNTPEVAVNPKALLATDNPYARELGTAHPATAFRRLMDLKDDPVARRTARAVAWTCIAFAPAMADKLRATMEGTKVTPDVRKLQEVAIERESLRCVDVSTDDFRRENGWYSDEPGGMYELVHQVYDGGWRRPEVLARMRAVAESKDPVALQIAGRANGARSALDLRRVVDLGGGKSIGAGLLSSAFELAACEYGASCGESRVADECIANGKCYRNLEEQLLAATPPEQREALLAARDVILTGVATRKWPAGWWDVPPTQAAAR